MTIPRAVVDVSSTDESGAWTDHSYTDLSGTYALNYVVGFIDSTPANVTVSKVGYNTTTIPVTVSSNADINLMVYLDDALWNSSGQNAIMYLDVVDEADNTIPVFNATIGIKNSTAGTNAWWYSTYPASTAVFETVDGSIPLTVGQTVEFAGYKSGSYAAGHTGAIDILSKISRGTLMLTKSDVIDPLDLNGSLYWYPVTIADATTGSAIADSNLNYNVVSDTLNWINQTSKTGKFNVTGKGPFGLVKFEEGDVITLEGNASGYDRGGFALSVDSDSSGTTQFINLVPQGISPTSGQFNAIVTVYDEDTTAAISGVSLILKNETGLISGKSTMSTGAATFKNLTAGDSYTITATKSGYSPITKTFTGGSGNTVTVDISMSSLSVNPTSTATVTATGTYGTEASDDDLSSWIRSKAIGLLDFVYLFIVLGLIGTLLRIFKLV